MQRHALATALLAPLLASFGQFTTAPDGSPECVYGMGFNLTPQYGRSATGDFDGDGLADFLCARNNQLEIVGSPGLYGWWANQLGSCNDLATIPSKTADVNDEVIVVGTGGAKVLSAFSTVVPATGFIDPVETPVGTTDWNGAKLVATAHVAGENRARIVGVMWNGQSLRTLRDIGFGYTDYEIALSQGFTGIVKELSIVDYEGDDLPEVTVMTSTGLHIYDLSGLHRVSFPLLNGWTYDAFECGRQNATTSAEWIVAIVRSPSAKQYVVPITVSAVHPAVYVLNDPDVVTMCTGDFNLDGSSDIVLSMRNLEQLWLLKNLGAPEGAPQFAMGQAGRDVIPYGSGSATGVTNSAVPALVDIDGDGDLDTLFPLQASSELLTRWNQAVNENNFKPLVVPTAAETVSSTATPSIAHVPTEEDPDQLMLTVFIEEPLGFNSPHTPTHLEIVVFEKEDTETNTRPQSIVRRTIPWTGGSHLVDIELPNPDLSGQPGPNAAVQFENMYIWHERLVELDGNGRVLHAFPAQVYGAETAVFASNFEHLMEYALVGTVPLPIYHAATGDQVGDVIPLPCLPSPNQQTPVL